MADKKKVVVAFSGGLDTSYTVMKLSHDMGYESMLHAPTLADSATSSSSRTRKTPTNWAQRSMSRSTLHTNIMRKV